VKSFRVVEAQRSRQSVQHTVGRPGEVASLELCVVVRAHAGQIGHFLAAGVVVGHGEPNLFGRDLGPP
jgi:hypothetical protein